MAKYKIEFDRETCIGALSCYAAAPRFWPRSEDGKVDLTESTYNKETKKCFQTCSEWSKGSNKYNECKAWWSSKRHV